MASLIGQIAAVLVGGCLVLALARRAGLPEIGLARGVALAVVALLSVLAASNVRESWHGLDLLREHNKDVTPTSARIVCTAVGVDGDTLAWFGARIPSRERFYFKATDFRADNGPYCIRFLMMPRLQVALPRQARYHVLWNSATPALVAAYRRVGATVEVYPKHRSYALARFH